MKTLVLSSMILTVICSLISGSTLWAQCSNDCPYLGSDILYKQKNCPFSKGTALMNIDVEGFTQYLSEEIKLEKGVVEASIKHIQDFNAFLQKNGKNINTASYADFYDYSAYLISIGQNTIDTYLSVLRYAYFKKANGLYVAALEVLDGREVIENLSTRLIEEFGEEFRNEIFEGIEMPPLGLHPKKKPEYTKVLIQRFEEKLGTERCAQFLNKGLRYRYEEARKPDRELFLQCKNIDEFLERKHKNFVAELEECYNKGELFFTQEITKEVLELVKNDKSIEVGVREGDKIIIKKIPHMAKEYLKETDEHMKRYYYCHCPWMKQAFLESDKPVSPVFCNCSAGYYRAYWEIVLDQHIQVEVVKSLLQGDSVCTFEVHLPKDIPRNLKQ